MARGGRAKPASPAGDNCDLSVNLHVNSPYACLGRMPVAEENLRRRMDGAPVVSRAPARGIRSAASLVLRIGMIVMLHIYYCP
ncbi:hypothetical protein NBRC116596_19670 [Litorivita sp. NS0012-18]